MSAFTRLVLTLALLSPAPLLLAESTDWTPKPAVREAEALLRDSSITTRERRIKALAWLEKLEKAGVELGTQLFIKALVLQAADKPNTGGELLKREITQPSGLSYEAGRYGEELKKMLPRLIRSSLKDEDFPAVAPLLQALVDYGSGSLPDAFEVIGNRLAKVRGDEAARARADVAALVASAKGLTPEQRDYFLGNLYGRKGKRRPTMTRPESDPIPVTELAQPRFLIIGGGGSYRNNQISLEKNVEFLQRLQQGLGLNQERNHILFSDGDDPGRDLQLVASTKNLPELNVLLASILGSAADLNLTYRSHQIEEVDGGSTEDNIKAFFNDVKLGKDEQLIVNFTGHGGQGTKEDAWDTCLYLWENKQLRMKDFCQILNKAPKEVPVVMVMVQCFSGGFANVIFKEGDPKKGLADYARCGFFATVHDRVAAGCTPAISEEDYREYSSYFFAALHGRSRTGQPIESADYDHDGRVCLAEAHAYALLTSTTIDISVKTTDVFLRHFSRVGPDPAQPAQEFLDTRSYAELLRHAEPCELAVLEGLSADLGLSGDCRIGTAERWSVAVARERKETDSQAKKLEEKAGRIRRELNRKLKARWPELSNPWHPETVRLMQEEGESILDLISSQPQTGEFNESHVKIAALRETHYELESQWAKIQRFVRTAENVALAANLNKTADSNIQERYAKLVALEHGAFPVPAAQTVAQRIAP